LGGVAILRCDNLLLLSLNLSDHLHDLSQAATFAHQFRPQAWRKRSAISSTQCFETGLPIAPGRFEVADALRHQ
jgi:hypothetical protein